MFTRNRDIRQILLVEDNPGDIRLTQEAIKEGPFKIELSVVKDGVEALDFLYKRGDYSQAPTPELVLLDLNLPRKDGRDVLSEIKADDNLKTIPVVILTTSEAEQDIQKTYRLHANCFITKPVDLDMFIYMIRQIEIFWLSVVQLPGMKQIPHLNT